MRDTLLIDELWAALHAPIGRVLETDNPDLVRQRLYRLRAASIDDFRPLSILRTTDDRIWILNRNAAEPDDAQAQ